MRMIGLIRQGIVSTQFFLYGKKNFTQSGYLRHVAQYDDPVQNAAVVDANDPNSDGVDLSGRTYLISGANQGIGREIATYAASKKATVYMLCRNKERAETAQREIVELTKNANGRVLLGDVSEPSHIKRVVSEFRGREEKLDCLVCNAGALFNDRRVNSEGQEITLMSHLVCGSYQLTKLLMPSLKNSDEARVIYVSSGGQYNTKFPEWEMAGSTGDHESKYDGNLAYSYAKRGQLLLAERLTNQYPDVAFLSSHPGWVRTVGLEDAFGSASKLFEPLRNTWEGSEGICWLMTTPKKNLESGDFYLDRKPQRKHIAGAFFTEGSFTKNTDQEVDIMMMKLEETCGV
jgi:dehydrogenase/reductase SDR family protein 12